jgi:glutamyl-tRNA reductase
VRQFRYDLLIYTVQCNRNEIYFSKEELGQEVERSAASYSSIYYAMCEEQVCFDLGLTTL